MDLSMYINNDYYIVVVLLYFIGSLIKKHKSIPNWCIPIILSIIGIIICCGISQIMSSSIDLQSILQGVLCGLTAVGTNEIIKQTIENVSISTSNDDSDANG